MLLIKQERLTKGIPAVTDIVTFHGKKMNYDITAAIEKGSQHPLHLRLLKKQKKKDYILMMYLVEDFQSITGKGIKATVGNEMYYIGSPNLFEEITSYNSINDIKEQITQTSSRRENRYDFRNS